MKMKLLEKINAHIKSVKEKLSPNSDYPQIEEAEQALYIRLGSNPVDPDYGQDRMEAIIDYDKNGNIVGVELIKCESYE